MPPCGGHPGVPVYGRAGTGCFKSCPRVGGIEHPEENAQRQDVSSRAPVWGASSSKEWMNGPYLVSSRAPVWGASAVVDLSNVVQQVSSRAPVWGASLDHLDFAESHLVSSRAPVWGASSTPSTPTTGSEQFQVVPPCGGHLDDEGGSVPDVRVSSRAPVWGASERLNYGDEFQYVSSRAPVWGASRERGRLLAALLVSSRAPVWGASLE